MEQSYKEKYEQALSKAKDMLNYKEVRREDMEYLFPELEESEDEKVRKELIKHLKELSDWKEDEVIPVKNPSYYRQWASWLEKQGENCLVNFDEAEKEKYDFVSGQFIECRKSFNGFKKDNSYWLEYVGDDNYIGRSDNILNQKFHITPRQLFTLFTWQHRPKENNVNEETNAPTGYGKYVDECLYEASKHFFSEGEDKYSVADLFYAGVRCGKSWLEKQGEQEKDILEDAILDGNEDGLIAETIKYKKEKQCEKKPVIEMKSAAESLGMDSDTYNKIVDECIFGEQKPTDTYCHCQETGKCFADGDCKANWSEEDDKVRTTIINEFEQCSEWCCANGLTKEDCIDWLKSLKDRVQPKQEWSEEDESILQGIWDEILANKHDAKECEWKTYDKFLDWLKSLSPQK